jgi:hypothetical protein
VDNQASGRVIRDNMVRSEGPDLPRTVPETRPAGVGVRSSIPRLLEDGARTRPGVAPAFLANPEPWALILPEGADSFVRSKNRGRAN